MTPLHRQRVGHLSQDQKIALYLTFFSGLTILIRGIGVMQRCH